MLLLYECLAAGLISLPCTFLLIRRQRRHLSASGAGVRLKTQLMLLGSLTGLWAALIIVSTITLTSYIRGRNFPGGEVPFAYPTGLNAINGYHKGTGSFVADRVAGTAVPAKWRARLYGDGGDWGEELKTRAGSGMVRTLILEGVVEVPKDAKVGQTLTGTVQVDVTYPQMHSGGSFSNVTVAQEWPLSFTVREAGWLDRQTYEAGFSMFIALLAGLAGSGGFLFSFDRLIRELKLQLAVET